LLPPFAQFAAAKTEARAPRLSRRWPIKPKNDTGPTAGTFIFSLPPSRALSGLKKDRRQNAVALAGLPEVGPGVLGPGVLYRVVREVQRNFTTSFSPRAGGGVRLFERRG
jgi:hypothetical protein